MSTVSRGFQGRRRDTSRQLPPGQYLTNDFPVRPDLRRGYHSMRGSSSSPQSRAKAIGGVGLS
jgi:hypothetical protein